MQTRFTLAQLADPDISAANDILRSCVHCGFCLPACPTYALLGDERDGPRGRIYLIKEMLEEDRAATPTDVTHIDRCLSCMSCMTACPSGVNYMHLVDIARERMADAPSRSAGGRAVRALLSRVLPWPRRFRAALALGALARPFARLLPWPLRRMVEMMPRRAASGTATAPGVYPADGARRFRVALLAGCVQQALAPAINAATIRLLTRLGCEVVVAEGAGCCGALDHHMGRGGAARGLARGNVRAWLAAAEQAGGLDAILVNASGCGTMVKDYGFLLRGGGDAAAAGRVSALARDISEFLAERDLIGPNVQPLARPIRVAWQAPCSLQHGQRVTAAPRDLLAACGFAVTEPADAHLCCGSAGTYNILQPEIADRLRRRKQAALAATTPDVVASGNIGCIAQLSVDAAWPVVHVVELLDWATGGPRPASLGDARPRRPGRKRDGGKDGGSAAWKT
ncbi:MAG: glycolate oxidase subunit GlcF [Alphaproteobacteria bacterium]|nr:glycolate oxidase subunit GlcF [Alphaproteobacteria bacterium]